jgi:hypothetical protein
MVHSSRFTIPIYSYYLPFTIYHLLFAPSTKDNAQRLSLRIIAIILGITVAALGGVIAYRALFLEPTSAVVITNTAVRELPDTFRVVGGVAMLAIGASLAFLAGRKRRL